MRVFYFLLILAFPALIYAQESIEDAEGDAHSQQKQSALSYESDDLRSEGTTISAGDAIEGDYIGQMVFTKDGSSVMVPHRQSDNITVFDFETQQIIQDIPVGQSPTEVAVSDKYAVVPCLESNEVYVIALEDYSVAAIFPAPAQPAKVRLSQDGSLAAVACDEADAVIVIDLINLEAVTTISDFPCFISKFSLITSGPRNTVYWSDFEFTPDNNYLVLGSDTGLRFYEITTGNITQELSEVINTAFLGLSGDGTRLIAVKTGNPGTAYAVDLAAQNLEATIDYEGFISSAYSSVAVNFDGSRALVPGSSGVAVLLRFDEEDVQEVNTTSSANWVGRSADYQYAISGQFYFTLIDFETGAIAGQSQGRPIQNGVISPVDNRVVATDPLRYESLDFYTFDESGFDYLGRQSTGSELEADIPYAAAFTPEGDRLLVINSLSGSISVIDVASESLEAIIPLSSTETFQIAITSDGDYALVAKRLENEVDIISLETLEVVQTIPSGGSKPDQVFILPGDEYAYVLNSGGTDAIGVIALDGENSQLESSFTSGNTGISWTNYGIRSDLKFSPDGQYALLATPFDSEVQVIDIVSHQIVASVAIDGFPLQLAISDETEFGIFAAVTLKNEDAIAIIAPIGPDAAILETYPCGNNPTRIAYNTTNNRFGVCLNDDNAINYFDLESLSFSNAQSFNNHTPIAVDYTTEGEEVIVLRVEGDNGSNQLSLFGSELLDLPSTPIHHFALSEDGKVIAVNLPVTDEVFIAKVETTGTASSVVSKLADQYKVSPNPSEGEVWIEWKSKTVKSPDQVDCRIYDMNGKIMGSWQRLSGNSFRLDLSHLSSGVYWYQVMIDGEGVLGTGKLVRL